MGAAAGAGGTRGKLDFSKIEISKLPQFKGLTMANIIFYRCGSREMEDALSC